MTAAEKITELRSILAAALAPRIDRDYWLLEIPHYHNVGDTLIWQGEMDFLRTTGHRCLGMRACDSRTLPNVKPNDLVLFQGGGNFGDLWIRHHDYKKRIMLFNPHNRYLVFPQTVYWVKEENMRNDAEFFAKYDCTICVRDRRSYDLLKANFKNEILLLPDMAFWMDMSAWTPVGSRVPPVGSRVPRDRGVPSAKKPLILRRTDQEFKTSAELERIMSQLDADVQDWHPMTHVTPQGRWHCRIVNYQQYLGWAYEYYMYNVYRPYLIRAGIQQLLSHTDLYTTRLHACILGLMLDRPQITLFDNSYGKNRGFYDAWLHDCENVRMSDG